MAGLCSAGVNKQGRRKPSLVNLLGGNYCSEIDLNKD